MTSTRSQASNEAEFMNAEEALLSMRDVIESCDDEKVKRSFYLEFHRRLLVLQLTEEHCKKGSTVIDLGASPFLMSCALKLMGYEVLAYDYDPQPYLNIAEECSVKVHRCDLERDDLSILSESVDCAVFSEVIEHLNPYYINHVFAEVNRVLKLGGKFIVTTPNIASLFRRIKLLFGIQPQYAYHVHEYTKSEIEKFIIEYGFKILKSHYTEVNDLSFIDATLEEYIDLRSYWKMLKIVIKKPSRLNILRAIAYPIVKIAPSLRMLIIIVAEKERSPEVREAERWG